MQKATEKQLQYIKSLGGKPKKRLSKQKASKLIDELKDKAPPTKTQKEFIEKLGGTVPETRNKADRVCEELPKTAIHTEEQRKKVKQLGADFHENATHEEAQSLISDLERDADPEEGRPPTKTQLNEIKKLGGDPTQVKNRWRADYYIDDLEGIRDEFEDRVENALDDWTISEYGAEMPVKKPSRTVMREALKYGDSQGWQEGWETPTSYRSSRIAEKMLAVAIYNVDPDRLKEGAEPPTLKQTQQKQDRKPEEKQGKKSNSLKTLVILALVVLFFIWLASC